MSHILAFYFLSQVVSISAIIGAVTSCTLDVVTKDVEFGKNATLKCSFQKLSILLNSEQHPQWEIKGLTREAICDEKNCTDYRKYSMPTHDQASSFSLIIYNFSETDLNTIYTCSCGFETCTKNLTEDDISLFIKPTENSTIDNTAVENGRVNIHITVSEVYPIPLCSVAITTLNKTITSESKLNVTALDITRYRKKVILVGVVHTGLEECERRMVVECCLSVTLKKILERNITVCKKPQVNESQAQFYVVAVTGIVLAIVVSLIALRYKNKRCRLFFEEDLIKNVSCCKKRQTVAGLTGSSEARHLCA